jgi:Phage head-tail joining protein
MRAGSFTYRAYFYAPKFQDDERGGSQDGWLDPVSRLVSVAYRRGGEAMDAARLEGRQTIILTVLRDSFAKTIASDWGVKIDGIDYAVTEPPTLTESRIHLEMMAQRRVGYLS